MARHKIAYITLLDQYHPGIYDSQVIDVIKYWNKLEYDTRLYAFLSIKELIKTDAKQKIKNQLPNARVLPAFPKLRWFRATRFLLAMILFLDGRKMVVARNVFACTIALWCKKIGVAKKVLLDARSATSAEIKEFDVFPVPYLRDHIEQIEKEAVLKSDFRLAVSDALICYWKKKYNYTSPNHVVVPCTLNQGFSVKQIVPIESIERDAISVVYAGSNAPWQGLNLIDEFLEIHPQIQCTLLTKENALTAEMKAKYGPRLQIKWLKTNEVVQEMTKHDYGLLLRPFCETNKVASPGKFAEYLAAGLNVICSKEIGDYASFIAHHSCGMVWDNTSALVLNKTPLNTKKANQNLVQEHFLKSSVSNTSSYLSLLKLADA